MTKRISITLDENVARKLLDIKQDYENSQGISISLSAFIAMLIRTYGTDA